MIRYMTHFLKPEDFPIEPEDLTPEPVIMTSITEKYAAVLNKVIDKELRNEELLEQQLADITERLRQTRLVLSALAPALARVTGDTKGVPVHAIGDH